MSGNNRLSSSWCSRSSEYNCTESRNVCICVCVCVYIYIYIYIYVYKGKGKFQPRTGHEGTEGE